MAPSDEPFLRPPATFATDGTGSWQRGEYRVGLVGDGAIEHEALIARAGYKVVAAPDGDVASDLFSTGTMVDALVLDFTADGRPPEAVLLFARRTSAGAPIIALVPPELDEAYRRAFNAGARDVVPLPARGEDMLAAIDVVLEPRGLADTLAKLRQEGPAEAGPGEPFAVGDIDADTDAEGAEVAELRAELTNIRTAYERLRRGHSDGGAQFRQQALDAITERDRLLDSRDRLKRKVGLARRQLKDREAQLRLTERACEELQRKLRDARAHRRELERTIAKNPDVQAPSLPDNDLGTYGATLEVPAPVAIDPEEMLRERAADEQKLNDMDELYRRYRLALIQMEKMRAVLLDRADIDADNVPELWENPSAQDVDVDRRSEIQRVLVEREAGIQRIRELEREVETLTTDLKARAGLDTHQLEVDVRDERDAHAVTLGTLDAIRLERDSLKVKMGDAELRIDKLERALVSANTQHQKLAALAADAQSARRDLDEEMTRHRVTKAALDDLQTRQPQPVSLPSLSETWTRASASGEEVSDDHRKKLQRATLQRKKAEEELARTKKELHALRAMVEALSEASPEAVSRPIPVTREGLV